MKFCNGAIFKVQELEIPAGGEDPGWKYECTCCQFQFFDSVDYPPGYIHSHVVRNEVICRCQKRLRPTLGVPFYREPWRWDDK
jgi:hypothetical protein